MRLFVNPHGRIGIGGVYETEGVLTLIVEPVAQEPDAVLVLDIHVELVRGGHVGGADAIEIMTIEIHRHSEPPGCGLPEIVVDPPNSTRRVACFLLILLPTAVLGGVGLLRLYHLAYVEPSLW